MKKPVRFGCLVQAVRTLLLASLGWRTVQLVGTPNGPEQAPRTSGHEAETLTVEQAARRLGIGRTLCYELARRGEIPVLRLGNRLLVLKAALDRLLAGSSDA